MRYWIVRGKNDGAALQSRQQKEATTEREIERKLKVNNVPGSRDAHLAPCRLGEEAEISQDSPGKSCRLNSALTGEADLNSECFELMQVFKVGGTKQHN
jgi:hypothetical protein